jgi:hypothetical protein
MTVPPQLRSTPHRHWLSLAKHGNGPMGVACARRPIVPDRTPRAAPRIDTISSALGLSFRHCWRRETFQRLNAVAGAVAHFQRAMMWTSTRRPRPCGEEGCWRRLRTSSKVNQPTYRDMRVNGQRVATWSSRDGWSGDSRPDAEWLQ